MALVDKINSKYGEQPEQYRIVQDGNAYLDEEFPGLSSIVSMKLAEPELERELQPQPEPQPDSELAS